ncbi:MAG: tRNA lysidine(34) synthetase TilS [Balneolaceae bacterium]
MNKSESTRMIERVETHLKTCFQDEESLHMVTGVSGGPDSMTLLYIFHRIGIRCTVIHCNYQLRGDASDKDQELVEETASMWGYECVSVRFDPDSAADNFQNWARNRRYQAFRDLKDELKADGIMTAHHQDDQLETIIQKIMRGAGLTAWQGMKIWDGELFRPLLEVSKAEILKFASENHIPYRLDSSNEESTYARNFLRNGWFPILDDLFPGWRDNILKVPERAKEHQSLADALARSIRVDHTKLDRKKLLSLDPEVQKPVLLHIIKSFQEDITVSSGTLINLDQLESLQTGKKLQLNDRWSLLRDRDQFVLQENEQVFRPEITLTRRELSDEKMLKGSLGIELIPWEGTINENFIQVDADVLEWPLKIRNWKDGDKMNPLGMEGHQSIADLLTNQKIPAAEKSGTRVIESFDENICAVIFPSGRAEDQNAGVIAEWARCTPETKTILQIHHSPAGA